MREKFLDAMRTRYACKEFDETKKVSKEDFDYILEAGRLSPSSFGFEPWEFLVITKPERRLQATEHSWGGRDRVKGASHLLVVLTRKHDIKANTKYLNNFMKNVQKLPEEVVEMKSKMFDEFQREDFKILENERTLVDWTGKQAYIALGNMLTASAYIGVNSCPIEGFHKEKTNEILRRDFDIDTDKFDTAYMVAFGYEKNPPKHEKTRRDAKDFIIFD